MKIFKSLWFINNLHIFSTALNLTCEFSLKNIVLLKFMAESAMAKLILGIWNLML
jgi:hypothetical protein